jgi:hypothetical protein
MCLKLSEDHGTTVTELTNHSGVVPRDIPAETFGAGLGRHPQNIDDVLHPNGDPVKAACELASDCQVIGDAGRFTRAAFVYMSPGLGILLRRLGTIQNRVEQFNR